MWFQHQTEQPTLYLVVDDNQAVLITWDTDRHATHPFVVTSYTALPSEWFLHGAPWHVSSFTTYLNSYITQHNLKKPLLVCACSGVTLYEKTVTLTHTPTQAAIPPDAQYAHYAWHTNSLPTLQKLVPTTHTLHTQTFEIPTPTSTQDPLLSTTQTYTSTQDTTLAHTSPQETMPYLINGMPHSDILRLRLCADKSGCILHRITTIRSSMQPLYTYCQQHGITPENNTIDNETVTHSNTQTNTLLSALCAPLPEKHNHHLVLSALGLSLFERKLI